ncbi:MULTISPECIES: structural protein P5 [unclassified Azospirillum]|uniref:structural protein P5 n=1 Tax=unclassified Azospirillum TaxID=2630922 RepID=UPI000D6451BE|nr:MULTISPECIES: structural protein P5 [unclassified Azospirillum]
MSKALPRGIRNNNPMNLKDFGIDWNGLVGNDGKGMCVFDKPENGLRAGMKDLVNDYKKKGFDTVEKLMAEFAPPSDKNPTSAYAAFVARRLGVAIDGRINLTEPDMLVSFAKAIVAFENGRAPSTHPADWYPTQAYGRAAQSALGLITKPL